jgi:hypothetical protein
MKFTQFMDKLLLKLGFLSVRPSIMWLHLVMPHPWCENTVSHHSVDLATSFYFMDNAFLIQSSKDMFGIEGKGRKSSHSNCYGGKFDVRTRRQDLHFSSTCRFLYPHW